MATRLDQRRGSIQSCMIMTSRRERNVRAFSMSCLIWFHLDFRQSVSKPFLSRAEATSTTSRSSPATSSASSTPSTAAAPSSSTTPSTSSSTSSTTAASSHGRVEPARLLSESILPRRLTTSSLLSPSPLLSLARLSLQLLDDAQPGCTLETHLSDRLGEHTRGLGSIPQHVPRKRIRSLHEVRRTPLHALQERLVVPEPCAVRLRLGIFGDPIHRLVDFIPGFSHLSRGTGWDGMEGEIPDRLVLQEELLKGAQDEHAVPLCASSGGSAQSVDVCSQLGVASGKR